MSFENIQEKDTNYLMFKTRRPTNKESNCKDFRPESKIKNRN